MSQFIKPDGINFSCSEELPTAEFVKKLRHIVIFIQQFENSKTVKRFDDWWEHDGLHFYQNSIDLDDLLKIIDAPKSLLKEMPGDFNVFIGIAPEDYSWYLRFYLDQDESGENPTGRFDVTFPDEIAEEFEKSLVPLNLRVKKQNAANYYNSIT